MRAVAPEKRPTSGASFSTLAAAGPTDFDPSKQEPRTAWKPSRFAKTIDRHPRWIYTLPPEAQPKSIWVGRSRMIVEQPLDYIRRLSQYMTKAA